MRTIKSVIIVTNAGQVEGVFTSFRALSQSNGVSHINIEGVYETYTETELKRKGEDLKLEKAIEPLREVHARVNPSRRSIFIAQGVYLLTK